MKVVILAGGYGTRLSEETDIRPKPMVEIAGKPILWHIMKHYSSYGFNEFIVLLGYKGYYIKEYFSNYFLHQSDVTFDLGKGSMTTHNNSSEPWKVTLLDTGTDTMTGGRLQYAKKFLDNKTFLLTYGDGLSDINIQDLVSHHKSQKSIMTLSAVQPEGRFGMLDINNGVVESFIEKPKGNDTWINAGFMVCEPDVFNYLGDDSTILEQEPLQLLAKENKLGAYKHYGFWKCMDTLRDKIALNDMWSKHQAKWKIWND